MASPGAYFRYHQDQSPKHLCRAGVQANPVELFLWVKGTDCSAELIGLYDVMARNIALQFSQ